MIRSRIPALIGLALLLAACAGLALAGDLRVHAGWYFIAYALAVAGYLLAARRHSRLPLVLVIGVAIAMRLILLPTAPSLSDDYHRYIWDGRVQEAGISPYRYAPNDPALDRVVYADRELINHPAMRTIYPPLTQAIFYAAARLDLDATGLKLLFGSFELLAAVAVALIAGPQRREHALALFLLNPLLVQETWGSAHLEIAPVSLAVLAALLLMQRRDVAAGVALGLGAALKFTPAVLLLPALVGRRARPLPLLGGFAAAFVLPLLPYLLSASPVGATRSVSALTALRETPEFNSGLFYLLRLELPYRVAAAAAFAVFVVAAVLVSRALAGRERTAAAFAWTATLFVLVLPVIHPWYWLAPAALAAAAGASLPIYLSLASPVTYVNFFGGQFRYRPWARIVAAAPLALLVFALGRRHRASLLGTGANDEPG